MKRTFSFLFSALLAAGMLFSCNSPAGTPTGTSDPDLGWLFLDKGPYTLETRVKATPGKASFQLVTDRSLMLDEADVIFSAEVDVAADSTICVALGNLAPGFYQVRLCDSVRFNIGVRPDAVVSEPDPQSDFNAFWEQTLAELAEVPLEVEWTEIPEFSNEVRTCYEVRYPAWGGAVSGGIISIPNAEGKYPVCIQYMGYGAPVYHFDPNADADRIDFMVSVRDQGIFKGNQNRWIDRGLDSKETFYYRGAFCDARQAVDFVASLEKADASRIVAFGESQGGALTFIAAAFDGRIKAIAPSVPFLGDYPDYWKIVWWPMHEVFEQADKEGIDREALMTMMSYFDVKNFAGRIHCPVFMAFGLQDAVCPPHTNFSIYNNLGTGNRKFLCVPTCGHAMWQQAVWDRERASFLEGFLR